MFIYLLVVDLREQCAKYSIEGLPTPASIRRKVREDCEIYD